ERTAHAIRQLVEADRHAGAIRVRVDANDLAGQAQRLTVGELEIDGALLTEVIEELGAQEEPEAREVEHPTFDHGLAGAETGAEPDGDAVGTAFLSHRGYLVRRMRAEAYLSYARGSTRFRCSCARSDRRRELAFTRLLVQSAPSTVSGP